MTLTVETWCEALESGRYKQGRSALRRDDAFCCLGVACDLLDPTGWRADGIYEDSEEDESEVELTAVPRRVLGLADYTGSFALEDLPEPLRAEVAGHIDRRRGATSLAHLNDSGIPFALIAKIIRARPKGLFLEAMP
jgi:hypothetical protein